VTPADIMAESGFGSCANWPASAARKQRAAQRRSGVLRADQGGSIPSPTQHFCPPPHRPHPRLGRCGGGQNAARRRRLFPKILSL
jgi:hypothetical protein